MTKSCFVIAPIGENGSPTRKRSNQILKYIIEPVLGDAWVIERADIISEPGIITNQIIDRLAKSDLVIADLSERNPNVFYELAVRHILRKPYVHLIAHDEDIPFDNAPVRAIKIDVTDLDSVDAAKAELEAQVANAIKQTDVESPISVSLTLAEIRTKGDDESLIVSTVLTQMGELKRQMAEIASTMSLDAASRNAEKAERVARAAMLDNAFGTSAASRVANALAAAPSWDANRAAAALAGSPNGNALAEAVKALGGSSGSKSQAPKRKTL